MTERPNRTLELFSGPKIFSNVALALGYDTMAIDWNAERKPNLVADIVKISAGNLPAEPLIVWAAPPDAAFNVADVGAHWDDNGYPLTPDAETAMETFRAALRVINEVKAKWWFLENPYGPLRHFAATAGFNRGYPTRNRVTIDHSDYGDLPSFRTDIWTNAFWWQPLREAVSRIARRPANAKAQVPGTGGRRLPAPAIAEMFDQLDAYTRSSAKAVEVSFPKLDS